MNNQPIKRLGLSPLETVFRQLQRERVIPFHLLCSSCPHLSMEEVEASVRDLQGIGVLADKISAVGNRSARLLRLVSF